MPWTCDGNVTENIFAHYPIGTGCFQSFSAMQAHAKSLNERLRTLISLLFGLAIGCALLFGESRWQISPLIEESLMLLACLWPG